jgi:hypothetical protein
MSRAVLLGLLLAGIATAFWTTRQDGCSLRPGLPDIRARAWSLRIGF